MRFEKAMHINQNSTPPARTCKHVCVCARARVAMQPGKAVCVCACVLGRREARGYLLVCAGGHPVQCVVCTPRPASMDEKVAIVVTEHGKVMTRQSLSAASAGC